MKYRIFAVKTFTYEMYVEANNEQEAYDTAFFSPETDWKQLGDYLDYMEVFNMQPQGELS